jgi:histone-lysine N-methyltransferase SETMAR
MSEREVPITVAQRVVIKFLVNENVGPNEIWRRLRAQYGESTLSKTQVKFWHKAFRGGRDAVQNTSHQRCPRTSITPENIAAIRVLIEGDRRLTLVEICKELGTPISYGSVQSIIKKELLLRKISARWVPRLVSDQQKTARLQISETLLARYEEEGDAFIHRIVTCDETWVHHYTPETKRASKEWRGKGDECPVKAKTRFSAGKVMATVFWDFKGVFFVDFLHARRTVNAAYYCDLLEKARAAYRSKR